MKNIEVRITQSKIENLNQNSFSWPMLETYIIGKLKDKGIPIIGTFLFGGLEKGTLHFYQDYETRDFIYIWEYENGADSKCNSR